MIAQALAQPGRPPAVRMGEDERERCGRGKQQRVGERTRPAGPRGRRLHRDGLGHRGGRSARERWRGRIDAVVELATRLQSMRGGRTRRCAARARRRRRNEPKSRELIRSIIRPGYATCCPRAPPARGLGARRERRAETAGSRAERCCRSAGLAAWRLSAGPLCVSRATRGGVSMRAGRGMMRQGVRALLELGCHFPSLLEHRIAWSGASSVMRLL